MAFRAILFDLDGTLVDSAPDIAGALNAAFSEAGLPTLEMGEITTYVGEGATRLVEQALAAVIARGAPPRDVPALLAGFRRSYREHVADRTTVYPGLDQVLAAVDPSRLAVLTNKPGDIARALLSHVGLARRFGTIIGDGDGYPRKPVPDAAQAVLRAVGARPEEALVVGDGIPDMRVARAAGCACAAVTWGYTPIDRLRAEHPDHLVATPEELARVIAGG